MIPPYIYKTSTHVYIYMNYNIKAFKKRHEKMGAGADLAIQSAGAVAGQVVGRLDNLAFGEMDRNQQLQQQGKLENQSAAIMHKYGEMSADAAHRRQSSLMRELQDINSPKERLRMIKEAGLSPSMMLAEGFGGQGGSSAPMGTNSAGSSKADSPSDMAQARTQMGIQMQQGALLQSEIEVNKATAAKLLSEADLNPEKKTNISKSTELMGETIRRINEDIENIKADTRLKENQAELSKLQQSSTELANNFNRENFQIILGQNIDIARSLAAKANVDEKTQQSLVDIAKGNVQTVLKNLQVADKQIEQITNSITVANEGLVINREALKNAMDIAELNSTSGTITKDLRGVRGILEQKFGKPTGMSYKSLDEFRNRNEGKQDLRTAGERLWDSRSK